MGQAFEFQSKVENAPSRSEQVVGAPRPRGGQHRRAPGREQERPEAPARPREREVVLETRIGGVDTSERSHDVLLA